MTVPSVNMAMWWSWSVLVVVLPFADMWLTRRNKLIDGAYFDYIVVGAGAAGSAVAARLALAGKEVLLIEAGGDPGLLSKIPFAATTLLGSDIDWFHKTVPNNRSCLSAKDKQCRFSHGRCLGGSTSINYMLYIRGNRRDYDFDIPRWSWKDLEPYFLRAEGLRSPLPASSSPYHNTSGPVDISFFGESHNPWRQRIVEGLMSLEFPFNPDVNAESQIGVTQALGYTYKGQRVTAATAYLNKKNVKNRLQIATQTRCTRVIIDESNVARGVTVVPHVGSTNKAMNFYVRREVILSAGTVGSAHLLLLSGVGPTDDLKKIGIPIKVNLPVGKDMTDHILPLMFVKVDQVAKAIPNLSFLGAVGVEAIKWFATRSGPFASNSVTDIVAHANTHCYDFSKRRLENKGPECNLPNLQLIFAYVNRYAARFVPYAAMKFFGKEVAEQILDVNRRNGFLLVSPILLEPKSKGWISLNSSNPMDAPVIVPNYLDDDRDIEEILKSITIVQHMVQTPAFSQHKASILQFKLRGCPEPDQVGYWKCYARHLTNSVFHAVGTVALGTVLDEKLRVREVKRLRVGDLSILPKIPHGNTAAVAIAIGERLADLLLQNN